MASHLWGDEDFDWKALDEAMDYLYTNCRRYARLGLWIKEKYGTMRVSTTCAFFTFDGPIHHIFYPGHAFYRWPKWFRTYIDWPIGSFLDKIKVLKLLQWYQLKVLKFFWKRAAKKWPQVSEEILDEYKWVLGEE